MTNLLLTSLSSSNRIKKELAYGEDYRHTRSKAFSKPLNPVRSPLDVTYFVRKTRKIEKLIEDVPRSEQKKRGRCKSKSEPQIKNTFWERAKLTHKQYTDVLSTPHLHSCGDNEDKKKFKSKTTSNICSPRIIQMSCPNKRRILANWQRFGDHLPAEILQRFHDMLHTDQNIDLQQARKYFKMRDRKKKQLALRKKLRKKRKKNKKNVLWLRGQIEDTSTAITNFFSGEPRLDLSYKQLLLSDTLMVLLAKYLKKQNPILRYSRNSYDKELVKMVDKIAVWIDSVSKIVDMQSLEEEEEEKEKEKVTELGSTISSISEVEEPFGFDEELEEGETEGVEMEGEEEIKEITSLDRLIMILTHASPSYLGGPVEDMENVTRNEILNKIKVLNKDYAGATTPSEILEKILTDWAMHNQPSQVDLRVKNKIEMVSKLLAAMLAAEDVYGVMGPIEDSTLPVGAEATQPAGTVLGTPADVIASELEASMQIGENEEPLPGTMTEVIAPDGSVQLGLVDDEGEIQPVQMTPSGNLLPTVFDKQGKVVDKLFDADGNLLKVTFNKYGVPEPDTHNGPLYDDVKYEHELIHNRKGQWIPLCYDKDGNIIASDYDDNGSPIFYDENGNVIQMPPGVPFKIVDGKPVITDADGNVVEESAMADDIAKDTEEEEDEEEEVPKQEEAEEEYEEEGKEVEEGLEEDQEGDEGPEEEEVYLGEEVEEEIEEEEEEAKSSEEEKVESSEEEEKKPGEEAAKETEEIRDIGMMIIKGHKPKKVYEHSNDTVCCLSLKIWAVWLLEITHNAHNWTKWVGNVIGQVREYAAILRGEILLPNGQKKVLFKEDWNKFVSGMNEDVIAWRQYCRHVNDLTKKIIDKFHGKKVHCCEKCLQDHLIKDVVTAHETMRALTEALNCAGYWQRCLDEIVQATTKLTEVQQDSKSSSDGETGWSYGSSDDDDDKKDYSCYTKSGLWVPSPSWKKISDTPCHCRCKLKQLFPKEDHNFF